MRRFLFLIVCSTTAFFTACIGVDVVPMSTISTPQLKINTVLDTLKVGEDFQFSASVIDMNGLEIADANINWESLTPQIVTINSNGLVSALEKGSAIITAKYESQLVSLSFYVGQNTVAQEERAITFSGRNGYNVTGTGFLTLENGDIILQFNADFSSESGPGLVVYLSNNASSVQGGIELVALKSNSGTQSYNVSQILIENGNNTSIDLNTYSHVIIYCKPFGVLFGVGTLQN